MAAVAVAVPAGQVDGPDEGGGEPPGSFFWLDSMFGYSRRYVVCAVMQRIDETPGEEIIVFLSIC